jgi:replicative DNA helicase
MTLEQDRDFLQLVGETADPSRGDAHDWTPLDARAVPAFPVDALPAAVAAWVHRTAEHAQVPVDLPALAALGVLSAAAIGGAKVDCGTWEEELALFVLVAMPSGDRKSTVLRAAVEPLRALQSERRDVAEPRVKELRTRRDVLEQRTKKLTRIAADHTDAAERLVAEQELKDVGEELDAIGEPVMPRLFADDATPEALGGLRARHGSIAVLAAESAFIDNIVGRYSDGKANLHLVCAAYSGEPHTIDRKGRDPEHIDRPLVAIALTVQPHVLEALILHPIARAQGLVARFMYSTPETRLGSRKINAPAAPRGVVDAWHAVVRRVAKSADNADTTDITGGFVGSVGVSADLEVKILTLSPAAAALLTELQEHIEPRLAPGRDLHSIADWVGRHHGRVGRIAGLLHLCEHPAEQPISESTMRAALRIGGYLLEHGLATLIGPDASLRAAVRWLKQRGDSTVTQRDLHRGPLAGRGTAEDAASLADRLETLGVIRRAAIRPTGPGRPQGPTYHVHPDLIAATNHASGADGSRNGHVEALSDDEERAERLLQDHGDLA